MSRLTHLQKHDGFTDSQAHKAFTQDALDLSVASLSRTEREKIGLDALLRDARQGAWSTTTHAHADCC